MNEIVKVNYENSDRPTVMGRDLHASYLTLDFKDFFIQASKSKVDLDRDELSLLRRYIKAFAPVYGVEAIAYLCDSIDAERVLPIKCKKSISDSESRMKRFIMENFDMIFPELTFIAQEFQVDRIGRIDIFAKSKSRPVIIELKSGHKNPNLQLLAYGAHFVNPILIGITEESLSYELQLPFIRYYTFDEIYKQSKEDLNEV